MSLSPFSLLFGASELIDTALGLTPCGRRLRDAIADTILGRQESFEYVSTTTPGWATPPR